MASPKTPARRYTETKVPILDSQLELKVLMQDARDVGLSEPARSCCGPIGPSDNDARRVGVRVGLSASGFASGLSASGFASGSATVNWRMSTVFPYREVEAEGAETEDKPTFGDRDFRPAQAVQSAALDSLHWRTLSAALKKAVRAAILEGTLRPENEVVLALFVDRHLVGPARAEALAAIAARNVGDERVTDKVRELERG